MDANLFYRGGGFEVGERLLKTPRKTYRIDQIEYVAVQRPLLFFLLPPAVGLIGFAIVFARYLYTGEIVTLVAVSAVAGVVASLFGTLRVHSLALRDEEVAMSIGLVSTLREVRRAVENAMASRERKVDAP